MPKRIEVLAGTKFGHLTVLKDGPTERISGKACRTMICKCVCGKTHTVLLSSLRAGLSRSCGCHNGPVSERGKNKPPDVAGAIWFPLANNKWMLIDSEDVTLFEGKRLSVTKLGYAGWNANVNGKKTRLTAHRAVMRLSDGDGKVVDHKNRNKLDNRKQNLRICTHSENAANKIFKNARKYRGVAPHGKKWQAIVSKNRILHVAGVFACPIAAARAYDKKAKELYGSYAVLNFPDTEATNADRS